MAFDKLNETRFSLGLECLKLADHLDEILVFGGIKTLLSEFLKGAICEVVYCNALNDVLGALLLIHFP